MSRALAFFLVPLLLFQSGCASVESTHAGPPSYTKSAENYLDFASAQQLATYLRYGSGNAPLVSAHRGGPTRGYPENAIQTFDHVLRFGPALFETDVRVTADGVHILMHDETLDRTTTGTGRVEEELFADTRKLLLKDNHGVVTPFRIPTLEEALAWSEARAVLLLDLKPGTTAETIVDIVRHERAADRVILIVYSLESYAEFFQLAPELVYSVPFRSEDDVADVQSMGGNFENIIAWTGVGQADAATIRMLHSLNVMTMMGTFGEIDERAVAAGADVYQSYLDMGIDVIATDNVVAALRYVADLASLEAN